MEILINSIYLATEGEGVFIGTPQIFVRLQGCLIGCINCDSKDTWDFRAGKPQSISQVLEEIENISQNNSLVKRVSITGGDPLHPVHEKALTILIQELKSKNYFLNIEASGTRIVEPIFNLCDFISFDHKTPSTGVKYNLGNLELLIKNYPHTKFQIKSVIETEQDFYEALNVYQSLKSKLGAFNFNWCLTPAYNLSEPFPQSRFIKIVELNQKNGAKFRVIGQQHKWMFGPDQKNV
ncbi:MAG: 7-carboxy-7-deazaguanine synthase QueE [Bacteriovoracaceae bacterium]